MDPYFKIRDDHSDNKILFQIRLVYSNKEKVLRLDTTVKTMPIYWDAENQKILFRIKEIGQDAKVLNDILTEKLYKVGTRQCYKKKKPT